jgi:hypothetical protein
MTILQRISEPIVENTMMHQFIQTKQPVIAVKETFRGAVLRLGETLILAPDRLEASGVLDGMGCPFLLIGEKGHSGYFSDDAFLRSALSALQEQAMHAFSQNRSSDHGVAPRCSGRIPRGAVRKDAHPQAVLCIVNARVKSG